MTALHLSDHGATEDDDDEWSEEGSLPEPIRQELELHGMTLPSATSATASVEAAALHYLSTVVQSTPVSAMSPRHASEDAATIFQQATSLKIPLKEWMQAVLAFAAYNTSTSSSSLAYTVDVKDPEAVTRKAQDKYDGACHFVKDVVRGQITFPDTSTLVCGLLQAFRPCEKWEVEQVKNAFRIPHR